jgi:hypothetical protein
MSCHTCLSLCKHGQQCCEESHFRKLSLCFNFGHYSFEPLNQWHNFRPPVFSVKSTTASVEQADPACWSVYTGVSLFLVPSFQKRRLNLTGPHPQNSGGLCFSWQRDLLVRHNRNVFRSPPWWWGHEMLLPLTIHSLSWLQMRTGLQLLAQCSSEASHLVTPLLLPRWWFLFFLPSCVCHYRLSHSLLPKPPALVTGWMVLAGSHAHPWSNQLWRGSKTIWYKAWNLRN